MPGRLDSRTTPVVHGNAPIVDVNSHQSEAVLFGPDCTGPRAVFWIANPERERGHSGCVPELASCTAANFTPAREDDKLRDGDAD